MNKMAATSRPAKARASPTAHAQILTGARMSRFKSDKTVIYVAQQVNTPVIDELCYSKKSMHMPKMFKDRNVS